MSIFPAISTVSLQKISFGRDAEVFGFAFEFEKCLCPAALLKPRL